MAKKPAFRVGNVVTFGSSGEKTTGVIKEDRGPIGVNGRRLYAIQYYLDCVPEPVVIEMPEEKIRLVDGEVARR